MKSEGVLSRERRPEQLMFMLMRRTKFGGTAVVIAVALALATSGRAHETDQFTLPPGREFADLGRHLNNWAYQTILRGVEKTNDKIRRCLAENGSERTLRQLQSRDEIVRAVNGEFPNAYDVIEGMEALAKSSDMKEQYPGQVIGFEEPFENIFQHVHFPLDPRQIFRIWHACTFKVYGTYLGSDKVGHFTDMGMHYYRAYAGALRDRKSEKEAIAAAVRVGTHGPIFSERGMVGYLSAGAYSNADLAANFQGFLFYRNLTDSMKLEGKDRPAMLERDGPYWKTAAHVKKDSDFFAAFISDHLNEALNPSHFESAMRDEIRRAIKSRTEIVLARYADEHGNRRSRAYFDQMAQWLRTYYGQNYGYRGPKGEIITIGVACFETFKPDARVSARDLCGNTPLHAAAAGGNVQAVRQLIESGADVNAQVRSDESYSSEWGNAPLHYAARDGRTAAARVLIEAGADINARNDRGQTPLHRAISHPEIVSLLIEKGADVNIPDTTGQTPLHWAAADRRIEAVELFLAGGANVDASDHAGRTPLHRAARSGNTDLVAALLAGGANVNAKADLGVSALHVASARGNQEIVERLIAAGADVQLRDEFGWTALHDACARGFDEIVSAMLSAGMDVNATEAHGATPLHLAARAGRAEMVAALLSRGADQHLKDTKDRTAFDVASSQGHHEIALLLSHGQPTATIGAMN